MVKGYLFACTDKSERECLDNNLLGTSYVHGDAVLTLEPGDYLFLINLDSDKLFGPFHASSEGKFNLDTEIWGDRYPYQVKFIKDNESTAIDGAKKLLSGLGLKSNELLLDFEAEALSRLLKQPQILPDSYLGNGNSHGLKSLVAEESKRLKEIRKTYDTSSLKSKLLQKPRLETTTLWDFPTQSYGTKPKGSNKYAGVTPAFIIYNLVRRYTKPGDLVVDPMCGSGTTIDVCKEENRNVIGYDIVPTRPDIIQNDARRIPLEDNSVDLVFIDSPYGDNIKYNQHLESFGNISAEDESFYDELEKVMAESARILKPGKVLGWLIGDQWVKRKFTPVGFKIYERLCKYFEPIDVICVARRSQSSNTGIWHNRALRFNFYLRGFKYLHIVRKPMLEESKSSRNGRVKWAYYARTKANEQPKTGGEQL